jgi:hypothetical protein
LTLEGDESTLILVMKTEQTPDAKGFLDSLVIHHGEGLKVAENLNPKVAWLILFLAYRGNELEAEERRLVDFFYRRVFG